MEDIAEVFYLTSIEQVRAIADTLRLRLVEALQKAPLTVTQLGERVGESPAKVHYHVRELERIGVVRLVETRERGGILEKYYRAVAKSMQMSPDLLQTAPHDEVTGMVNEWFQLVMREATRALTYRTEHPELDEPLTLASKTIHATTGEFRALLNPFWERSDTYAEPRGIEDEHEWIVSLVAHRWRSPDADAVVDPIAQIPPIPPVPPVAPAPPKVPAPSIERSFILGGGDFSRKALEEAVASNRPLSIMVIGVCHFPEDIPAELVDRAVVRFRHWGQLVASPEVREVLRRKGGDA